MSGSNSNMTLVANVAEDLDGTDPSLSPYTWTCPDVDPYSTIYFYQFTTAAGSNSAWTTRFTVRNPVQGTNLTPESVVQIASPAGGTAVPSHSNQPNGDGIPWGIGVLRSGSSVASREKHRGSSSMGDEEYDEEVSTMGTSSREGGGGSSGTSSEDSEDSEVLEDDETESTTNSGSSKSALKDAEEGSDVIGSKNGTEGSNGSLASAEDDESGPEGVVSTSSRLKTVHSKPTPTPFSTYNVNVATLALPLPSTPPPSAQPVGCAGGTNATNTYCSAPGYTSRAAYATKLDPRVIFVTVLVLSFGLLY